jgi:hypothetical protein
LDLGVWRINISNDVFITIDGHQIALQKEVIVLYSFYIKLQFSFEIFLILIDIYSKWSHVSSVHKVTNCRMDSQGLIHGRDFSLHHFIHSVSASFLTLSLVCTVGSFPMGKADQSVALTIHLQLGLRFVMHGTYVSILCTFTYHDAKLRISFTFDPLAA